MVDLFFNIFYEIFSVIVLFLNEYVIIDYL